MKNLTSSLTLTAILLALLLIFLETFAQIFLKMGVTQLGEFPTDTWHEIIGFIGKAMLNPFIVGAILTIFFSFMTWLTLLSKIDLSIAHPITSLVLVTITLSAHFVLDEPLNVSQMLGVALIIVGVFIVSDDAQKVVVR